MISQPRIAVIGVGSIGSKHIDRLLELGYQDIVGVEPRPMPHDERIPIVSHLEDIEASPTHVIICTPPDSHYKYASHFLDKGIYTFIEKPMTLNASQAKILCEKAKLKKVVLAVGYMERAHHIVKSARKYVKSLVSWNPLSSGYIDCHWKATEKTYPLSVAAESSHAIDTAQFVFGRITAVKKAVVKPTSCTIDVVCEEDVTVCISMDMNASPVRRIRVYSKSDVFVSTYGSGPHEWEQCYKDELLAFLMGVPLCDGVDGARVVGVLEELR